MTLSILICTIPSRALKFESLISHLESIKLSNNYSSSDFEILYDDSIQKTIGEKRNDLIDKSIGDFVVFIDDDDSVTPDYLPLILNAIKDNPDIDCVGIRGYITFNGGARKAWSISIHNGHWHETEQEYKRTPNHISPIKREHAIKVKFPHKNHGEDLDFSNNVLQYLKKEFFINKEIYHYDFYYK